MIPLRRPETMNSSFNRWQDKQLSRLMSKDKPQRWQVVDREKTSGGDGTNLNTGQKEDGFFVTLVRRHEKAMAVERQEQKLRTVERR
ncbi:hypothetical protein F2Q69_00049164 [Brassica cretica]|uniref:Uncharacterized protein n=1 Tax=Brassica cretica TaxID=69181 RepID=A0A8S9PWP4_BRACR|nr:hypothetical protein F2Q69_00049164 [Brassica cretica]